MKTKTFLRKKNKIVKAVTGLTLVPENQIVDEEPVRLDTYNDDTRNLHSGLSPYCISRTEYIISDCSTCPMHLAGNNCKTEYNSTWEQNQIKWIQLSTTEDQNKLLKLVKKYNKQFKG